jgi:hypothetical protein
VWLEAFLWTIDRATWPQWFNDAILSGTLRLTRYGGGFEVVQPRWELRGMFLPKIERLNISIGSDETSTFRRANLSKDRWWQTRRSTLRPSQPAASHFGDWAMFRSAWRPRSNGSRIATGILVIAALGFIAFWRFDSDRLKAADRIDQTKVDPRPAISTTINSILGTTPHLRSPRRIAAAARVQRAVQFLYEPFEPNDIQVVDRAYAKLGETRQSIRKNEVALEILEALIVKR